MSISISNGALSETSGVAFMNFAVTLSAPAPAGGVRVFYRTVGGTASEEIDYNALSGNSILIAQGQSSGTISIQIYDDTLDELDESLFLELYNPVGMAFAGGGPTLRASGVILDNDGVGANDEVFVSDATIVEGESGTHQAVFEVRLSRAVTTPTTFTYQTVNGSAVAGSDYAGTTGTVTIPAGQTTAMVSVTVNGDGAVETSETFSLIVAPIGVGPRAAAGTATILDDDAGGGGLPVISISNSTLSETSGVAFMNFAVTLSAPAPAAGGVRVFYRTVGGTASEEIDYNALSGNSILIAQGQSSGTISIQIYDDTLNELDENFSLEIYNPVGAVLAGGQPTLRASGVILDNDGVGANEEVFVSDVTIVEGESGTHQAVFEVRLSRAVTTPTTFAYQTVNGSATAGSDYTAASGSFTILAGQQTAYVAVNVAADGAVETSETFSLIVAPIGVGPRAAAGTATILDDDAGGGGLPVISISNSTLYEINGVAYLDFAVTLSTPAPAAGGVRVFYRTVGGTASEEIDYNALSGNSILIAQGQSSGTISIQIYDDTILEPLEIFGLELYNPSGAVFAGNATTLVATGGIIDNDGTYTGTTGNDILAGTIFGDTIAGGGGDDSISGNEGHDSLLGGIGNDTLRGNDGVDTLLGGDGADSLDGGTAADLLDGGPGNDTLAGGPGDDAYLPDAGDTLVEASNAGTDRVTVSFNYTLPANVENLILTGSAATGVGNGGSNVLFGTDGDNVLDGLQGNDVLYGGGGTDGLRGGDGSDSLFGGAGTDYLDGGAGSDFLDGGAGYDLVDARAVGRRSGSMGLDGAGNSTFTRSGEVDTYQNVEVALFVDGRMVFDANDVVAQVNRLYGAAFLRGADQGGLNGWSTAISTGTPIATVAQGFLVSAEFAARYGTNLSTSDYVERLYENALGRPSDAPGKAGWVNGIDSGAITRADALVGFSESGENRARTQGAVNAGLWDLSENAAFAARLYDTTFGRLPDLPGLRGWKEGLDAGSLGRGDMVNAFVASGEFAARYGSNPSTSDFVELLYNNALRRASDAPGKAGWVNGIDSGQITRADAVLSFSESSEHVTLTNPNIMNENPDQFGILFAA